ncbi:hypothetical protein J2T02_003422 [Chitinophaga terrae (ex Kim and Jung 2007)]|uniref:sensor histidine kinase n=1 Tax=Chitinophaga terrae (ex Kim and Jung 2007) TaxID=408074 RepID=UPI00278B8CF3|nr:histidine kinase [Chitinophaga terrae (ex Kim and Jung 2007)]MDQ0108294.1 hypothetical protein [Chitinophaga terrae (ex Kim and Jung 2007)]
MSKQIIRGNVLSAFIISFLVWMVLYGTLLYYWFNMPLMQAVTDSSVHVILLSAAGVIVSHNVGYYRPSADAMKYGYVGLLSCALAVLWVCLSRWILVTTYPDDPTYIQWLNNAIPIHAFVGWMMISGIGMRSQMWYEAMEQQKNQQRQQDTEKIVREAELFKLRQQLQPHFLFNSLNSINALIMLRPKEAREMVLKLSDFLRGSLKQEDDQWITLEEELKYLQLYLDIEKVRFGHRLSTAVIHDVEAEKLLMPPMLLQPVVENAIKFGLYDTTGEITISIHSWIENQLLHIAIENPFDSESSLPNKGTGFGLSSIQRRLYLLFARQDLLETKASNGIFTTIIKVPQTK